MIDWAHEDVSGHHVDIVELDERGRDSRRARRQRRDGRRRRLRIRRAIPVAGGRDDAAWPRDGEPECTLTLSRRHETWHRLRSLASPRVSAVYAAYVVGSARGIRRPARRRVAPACARDGGRARERWARLERPWPPRAANPRRERGLPQRARPRVGALRRRRRRRRRRDGVVGEPRARARLHARSTGAASTRRCATRCSTPIARSHARSRSTRPRPARRPSRCARGDGRLLSRWLIAWVGDCRIYRVRAAHDEPAELLTRDDTYGHLGEEPPPGGSPDDPARMVGNGAVDASERGERRARATARCSCFAATDCTSTSSRGRSIRQLRGPRAARALLRDGWSSSRALAAAATMRRFSRSIASSPDRSRVQP